MDFFGLNLYALHGSLGSVCLGLLPNLESFQSLFLPAPSVPSSFNSGPVTTQMLDLLLFSHTSQRHRSLLFSVDFPLSPRLREFCCSVLKLTDSLLCYLCCTAELTQQELVFSFAFSFYNFPLVLSLSFLTSILLLRFLILLFVSRVFLIDCWSIFFYNGCFKVLVRKSQLPIHLGDRDSLLGFLLQVVISWFLVWQDIFSMMPGDSGSPLNCLF